MYKQDAMKLFRKAIEEKNLAEFKDLFQYYPVLDEGIEFCLIKYGSEEMIRYYLSSHILYKPNEYVLKDIWPVIYKEYKEKWPDR